MAFVDDAGLQQVWQNIADINAWMPRTAAAHNSIYRGKDITDKYLDGSLVTSIKSGTFDDVFVGDYFKVEFGAEWDEQFKVLSEGQLVDPPNDSLSAAVNEYYYYRIMELNRYPGSNNATIMPDSVGGTCPIHTSATPPNVFTSTAIASNSIWSEVVDYFVPASLQPHLVEYGEHYYNTSGTLGISSHTTASLLSEEEVFGFHIRSKYDFDVSAVPTQLAAFRLNPELIWSDKSWWLRSMSDSGYLVINHNNSIGQSTPNAEYGIRIKFVIGGNPS